MRLRCGLHTSKCHRDYAVKIQSAQVLLGLLPTTLLFGGPTIAEVAALSTYRPLLAVLLAFGSPAVNVVRLFRQIDIREPFERNTSTALTVWSRWLRGQNKVVRKSVQVLSYVGATAAIANNVRNSVRSSCL